MSDQTFHSNGIKVLRNVRAVFPHLSVPDNRFGEPGDYKISVDVTPEIEARFQAEIADVVAAAHERHGVTETPTNVLLKKGTNKRDEPFYRLEFKMKAERKNKGKVVSQKPQVVDAHKNPLPEDVDVYSGSLVNIGYELQYSITGFGCNVSAKLKAVQVVKLVDASGVSVDDLFDDEDGFVADTSETNNTPAPAPAAASEVPSAGGVGAGGF